MTPTLTTTPDRAAPCGDATATRPCPGARLRWQLLSALMRTVGRASAGIDLGYRHGFDSGVMLDYVYENRAHGRWGYGALVDRLYLDSIGWRGIRARKALLQAVLWQIIRTNRGYGRPTVLLDVAAGPGRYLQELAAELRDPDDLTIICRDLAPAGLEQGRRQAAARGLTCIRYEPGDACDPTSLAAVAPRPNVVVASGIYELLDAERIRRSMAGIHAVLAPGGHFVFTTQVHHPQLELIANVLPNRNGEPWVMECHSLAEVEGYARQAGFGELVSQTETVGLFAVTRGRKPSAREGLEAA
jgi:SAM-dependent methyltransferase